MLIHPLAMTRAGLSMLVSSEPGLEVLDDVGASDEALRAIDHLPRKSGVVVVIDVDPATDLDSFSLIRQIRDRFPTLPILAVGATTDEFLISRALFQGADGFCYKNGAPSLFPSAIPRVAGGEVVLEGLEQGAEGALAEAIEKSSAESVLTRREVEVLSVASEGLTAREIGRRLGMQERTVTTHLGRIYKKLGASGRVAALVAASRQGLVLSASRR